MDARRLRLLLTFIAALGSMVGASKTMATDVVMGDAPLPADGAMATLDVYSLEQALGAPTERRVVEGQITVGFPGIAVLPPPDAPGPRGHRARSVGDWDFYLLYIPFSLHMLPEDRYYRRAVLKVAFDNPEAVALDLFPEQVDVEEKHEVIVGLNGQLKFDYLAKLDAQAKTEHRIVYSILKPTITAYGLGEREFYWQYAGQGDEQPVAPGARRVFAVLQVPHGLSRLHGWLDYQATLAKDMLGLWTRTETWTDRYQFDWALPKGAPGSGFMTIRP